MATHGDEMAHEGSVEKHVPDHVEDATSDEHAASDYNNDLNREKTLSKIDVENRQAHKGKLLSCDDSDGKVEWTMRSILASIFLCTLYTGSQIILYFVGGSLSFITKDLNAPGTAVWLPVANTLTIAAVAPYCGYLQDLFGKRYIALLGSVLICVGIIVLGTAHTFGQGVAGMSFAGAGAAIGELTGLAGIAEIVPVRHRGYSIAVLTMFVFVFTPYLFYCQLLATRTTLGWRWTAWISLIYNGLTGLGLLFTYFPHNHTRAAGFSYTAILKKIDYLGGFLSITGLTLFLVALQAAGYTHPWKSAHVLAPFMIGFFLLCAWVVWEAKFAPYPMVPSAIFQGQRIVALAYVLAFVGGMNFFSVLNFLPLTYSSVYVPDPIQIGLKGLPPAISTTIGAIGFNAALSTFKNNNREVLLCAAVIMTVFGGALAVMTPDNPKLTVAFATLATFGVGGMIVPTASVALLVTPDVLLATTAALSLSVRTVGGSIGYTIYYNVFVSKLKAAIPVDAATYAIKAGLPITSAEQFVIALLTDPTSLAKVPGVTPSIIAAAEYGIQWAYAGALHYVWYTSIAFGVCAVICACFLPSTAKYQTNRVAVML